MFSRLIQRKVSEVIKLQLNVCVCVCVYACECACVCVRACVSVSSRYRKKQQSTGQSSECHTQMTKKLDVRHFWTLDKVDTMETWKKILLS